MPQPAIGPVALILRRGMRRTNRANSNTSAPVWRDLMGSVFIYNAVNWGGAVTWFLEVYVRATSAKALARLYDTTAGAEVANSTIIIDAGLLGVLPTPTRVRSSQLTLVDTHEYRIQYGVQDGGSGEAVSARLIAI